MIVIKEYNTNRYKKHLQMFLAHFKIECRAALLLMQHIYTYQ